MGKGENGSQIWRTLYVHCMYNCTHLLQCTCACMYAQYSTVALFLYYKKGYNQGKSPNVHTVRLPPDNIVSLFLQLIHSSRLQDCSFLLKTIGRTWSVSTSTQTTTCTYIMHVHVRHAWLEFPECVLIETCMIASVLP